MKHIMVARGIFKKCHSGWGLFLKKCYGFWWYFRIILWFARGKFFNNVMGYLMFFFNKNMIAVKISV